MNRVVIWNSYSSNNSSDYRLVAEFETPKRAKAMAKELRAFFETHAEEHDAASDEDDFDWPGKPTRTAKALGDKYGHTWSEYLTWGDECLAGDEPEVVVVGNALVLYHSYCSGGFGPDVPVVLEKAGAKLPGKGSEDGPPVILGSLELPRVSGGLADELFELFDQRLATQQLCDWSEAEWAEVEHQGQVEDVSYWVDGKRCTFTIPLPAANIEPFRAYLKAGGAKKLELRLASEQEVEQNRQQEEALAEAAAEQGAAATEAPAFDPAGLSFVFTGKLAAMTRAEAQARTAEIGGELAKSVTNTLDVLVIGDEGSPLYGEGSKGSKQTKAEALNAAGAAIRIISETAFLQLQPGGGAAVGEAAAPLGVSAEVYEVPTKGKIEVNLLFEASSRVAGADEILVCPDEIVAFAGDRGYTQRIVTRDCVKRTASNVKFPRAWLQGIWVDDDGTWFVGGEKASLYTSSDRGKNWKGRPAKGLEALCEGRVWSVARFAGELWVAGDGCLAREVDGTFKRVPLPGKEKKKVVHRLVVIGEALYAVGSGIWRSSGKKMVSELAKKNIELFTLALTDKGTLIAAGKNINDDNHRVLVSRSVWRKPHGGEWALLDEAAIGVGKLSAADIERKISYSEFYIAVVCTGGFVTLVAKFERPTSQMNAIRVSTDDGATFTRLPAHGKALSFGPVSAAVADGRGGVIVAACGGVFFRVSRDGIAPWKAKTKKVATKKVAAKKATKKVAKKKTVVAKKKTAGGTVGRSYLFTGTLASMVRAEAKAKVTALGGTVAGSVNKELDYLVVGDRGSPLFGEGKKGSKIIAAEKLIDGGAALQIISETDFLALRKT